ncbi:hypothetical protein KR51_00027850 [Rubidibacter lacunae KORDI 51-2]|uniref:HTH cro/C1-type domain-containing protein n=1 Tax=Rubidibacter lacunae KORDI 51-2 TaxID=582515 RepID=U5DM52_9CHRO|nr:RodZ domain-containing protein [Rubidibacter lacunae]ERN40795.1 hypothetical protein KR51_00027850 [Rubidibacter lacunae KORDI 51-2]
MRNSKTDLRQEQAIALCEIGARVRQEREAKGLTINEIAAQTRIQSRLLDAIESGDRNHLPEPVYVRALIKQFGDAVGLNGAELSRHFPTDTFGSQAVRSSWRQLPAAQLRPLHLYALYIALVIASVSGLRYFIQRTAQPTRLPLPVPGDVIARTPEDPSTASVSKPQVEVANAPGHSVTVAIAIKQDAWLRIVADGETTYEGIMTTGEERTWTAEEQLTVRTGNAGGVVVAFNKNDPEPLGNPGQVQEVTYQVN